MPLLTPSDLASYLGATFDAGQQSRARKLIDAVLAAAGSMLGYSLPYGLREHFVDGGERRVWLPEAEAAIDFTEPVTVTIYNANADLYESQVWVRTPFLRQDGSIDLYGAGYGPEAVKVSYTAGWDTTRPLPHDLKQALLELVAAKWSIATAAVAASGSTDVSDAPVKSITIGSLRKEFAVGTDSSGANTRLQSQAAAAMDTLNRYKRVRVF